MILAVTQTTINVAYLVASVGLIIGIKRLSSPATARSGNVIAAIGMAIALVFTLLSPEIDSYWLIAAGVVVGTVIGVASARLVKMTAMPQMVALFNGVGGGAAALIAAAEFHRLAPLPGHVLPEHMGAMLFSALIGWLVWQDVPNALFWIGTVMVCGGGILATREHGHGAHALAHVASAPAAAASTK